MDSQDHKTTATSTGHEGHGVHLCHRCGWPFPNSHPSAKHRRAHKRVCGTIDGYKIDDHHSAVSDDEHPSDEDEHTPSPNLVKENVEGSGKVVQKSNKSEDDLFSDAVTDFSDSGVSPSLDESFESVKELDKSSEQKGVEGDLHGGGLLKVDEIADKNKLSNDQQKSEDVPNPDASAEAILGQDLMKSVQVSNIQVQDSESASVALNGKEGKILDRYFTAVDRHEDLSDKSDSEAGKDDLLIPTGTLENMDVSEGVNNVVHSAKRSTADETVDADSVDKIRVNIDASVGVKEVSQSITDIRSSGAVSENIVLDENLLSTPSTKPDAVLQTLDATGENAGNLYASEGVNGKENRNTELKDSFSIDTVPTPDSTVQTFAPDDDQTTKEIKKDVDHCEEEKSDGKLLETGNEQCKKASAEVKEALDSKMPSEDTIKFPSSSAVESETRSFEELSKDENGSLESRDDGLEKSIPGLDTVVSGGKESELDHDIGGVIDKLEVPTSSIISEPLKNIHVTGEGVRMESVGVAEIISESKNINEIVSSEKTSEQSIPKESTTLTTDSELLSENSGNNVIASESIDTAGETSKLDHEDIVKSLRKVPENSTQRIQEASPTSIHIDVTSPGVGESLSSENISTLKSGADSKSLQVEVDDGLTKENDGISAVHLSGSLSGRSDSLEANCGSVVSDTFDTNSQKQKTDEARSDKSDTFEPPSFMTLVQSADRDQVKADKEIETVQNNQQTTPAALQAGWFPSLKNVVNESEGRKKNEEIIAKVTNWSPVNQQHAPLKSLLNDVKSPKAKQVPGSNQKIETETNDNNGGVTTLGGVVDPDAHTAKDQETKKDVEEWNSPARYPIEIKKEKKKKGRSYWVPFVCCSSAHRDL